MSNSYTVPSSWMITDGLSETSSDDIVKTIHGWEKIYPNGKREVLVSMKGALSSESAPFQTSILNPTTAAAGGDADWVITYETAVTITGTPRIILNHSTEETIYADYSAGSGTVDITFTYETTVAGDIDVVGNEFDLNSGTVVDTVNLLSAPNNFPADYTKETLVITA